tara:strand:+ start:552 stop:1121 length:570 start_codon:yes stop_codon:yes gene_type:complete
MNNMKIIMEGWRSHVEDQEYEMLLEALLSSHGLLNESMADDIKEKVQKIARKYGKRATTLAMAAMLATNAIAPSIAAASTPEEISDAPKVAQQIDDTDAEEETKKPVAQALKKIFQDVGDSFKKDGEIGKLFSKIDKKQDQMSDSEGKDLIIQHIKAKAEAGMDLTPDEAQLLDLYNQHGPNWDSKIEK